MGNEKDKFKNYYVYELLDNEGKVFYVGKGMGERAYSHEEEAKIDNKETKKLDKIRELEQSGNKVKIIVIGRYDTEAEAFAVESTLIHWVYGYDNLTNVQSGHGSDTIRPYGKTDEMLGVDIFFDGTYSERRKIERENNGIVPYMNGVKNDLETKLNLEFNGLNTASPKNTSISFDLENIKIMIETSNSTMAKTLVILIAGKNNSKKCQSIINKICEQSNFVSKNKGAYAVIKNSKRVKDDNLLKTFIVNLKELNKALECLSKEEMSSDIEKDFEIIQKAINKTIV